MRRVLRALLEQTPLVGLGTTHNPECLEPLRRACVSGAAVAWAMERTAATSTTAKAAASRTRVAVVLVLDGGLNYSSVRDLPQMRQNFDVLQAAFALREVGNYHHRCCGC